MCKITSNALYLIPVYCIGCMLRELRSHGMSTVVHIGYLFPEPSHNTTVLICCVVKNLPQHNTLKYTRTVRLITCTKQVVRSLFHRISRRSKYVIITYSLRYSYCSQSRGVDPEGRGPEPPIFW